MSLFNHQYHCTSLHCSLQCRFTSTETISTVRDGEPRMATSPFTHLLSSKTMNLVQCCFTSSETIVKDGETMTATSTFTQLLSSNIVQQLTIPFIPTVHVLLQQRKMLPTLAHRSGIFDNICCYICIVSNSSCLFLSTTLCR